MLKVTTAPATEAGIVYQCGAGLLAVGPYFQYCALDGSADG